MTFDQDARRPPEEHSPQAFSQPPVRHPEPAGEPVRPVWTAPVPRERVGAIVLAVVGLIIAGLAVLLVMVYFSSFLGTGRLIACMLLALIPLTAILLAVRWVDRWEPEPRPALWFALLWGAGISIVTALLVDLALYLAARSSGAQPGLPAGDSDTVDFASAVIQAPIVEETAKGFGILLLFWVMRRHFDGPVDGIVYAATIAAGFAFSENVQYFGTAMVEGGLDTLGLTFLVRGVLSPFAHVMFTICTGIALGIAARRTGAAGAIGYFLLGLVPAMLLHALWNGAFFFLDADASIISYYLVVQVLLFIVAVVVVVVLRRREVKVTVTRLGEYAAAGWFTEAEVAMLATPAGRRQARAWARAQPRHKKIAMQRFMTDATRLAFARERMLGAKAGSAAQADEARLLGLLAADRAAVLG